MALFFWVRDISCSISLMLREVFIVMRVWVGGGGVGGGQRRSRLRKRKREENNDRAASRQSFHVCPSLSHSLSLSFSLCSFVPIEDPHGCGSLRGRLEL